MKWAAKQEQLKINQMVTLLELRQIWLQEFGVDVKIEVLILETYTIWSRCKHGSPSFCGIYAKSLCRH